jgi:mono/diheme cytochrome c family protein
MKHVRLVASLAAGSMLLGATALGQEVDKKAERAWKSKCAACHGQTGKGDTEQGKKLKVEDMTAPAYAAKKDDELVKAILEGVKTPNGDMPGFKGEITPEQAAALVKFTRTFKK